MHCFQALFGVNMAEIAFHSVLLMATTLTFILSSVRKSSVFHWPQPNVKREVDIVHCDGVSWMVAALSNTTAKYVLGQQR
jgi:hypothetical protein